MTSQSPTRGLPPRRWLRLLASALVACLAVVFLPSSAWAGTDQNPDCADGWNAPKYGGTCSAGGSDDGGVHSGNIIWRGMAEDVPYLSADGWPGVTLTISSTADWNVIYEFAVTCAWNGGTGMQENVNRIGSDKFTAPVSFALPACAAGRGLQHIDVYVYSGSQGKRLAHVGDYWPTGAPDRPAADPDPVTTTPSTPGAYPDDTPDGDGCSWTHPLQCMKSALKWGFVPQQASLDQFADVQSTALQAFPMSWFNGMFTSIDSILTDCTQGVGVTCTRRSISITMPGTDQRIDVLSAGHDQMLPSWAPGVIRVLMWLGFIGSLAGYFFKKSLPVVNE